MSDERDNLGIAETAKAASEYSIPIDVDKDCYMKWLTDEAIDKAKAKVVEEFYPELDPELPKLNPSEIRRFKPRKNQLADMIALLHLPRMSIVLCFIIIGACLAENVYWDRVILSLIALALCLIAAYRMDELCGAHCGVTHISNRQHWIVIISSLSIACIIALYLAHTYSWWLFLLALIGCCFVICYNAELYGGVLHNHHVFGFSWGFLPLVCSYYLNALTIDKNIIPAIIMGIFAIVLAEKEIKMYGNCLCTKKNYCKEFIDMEKKLNEFHIPNIMRKTNLTATGKLLDANHNNTCHGQHCWVRLQIPPEVYHHQWKIIKLNWLAIWCLTAAFVALKVV